MRDRGESRYTMLEESIPLQRERRHSKGHEIAIGHSSAISQSQRQIKIKCSEIGSWNGLKAYEQEKCLDCLTSKSDKMPQKTPNSTYLG